jgi:hypothetical protein
MEHPDKPIFGWSSDAWPTFSENCDRKEYLVRFSTRSRTTLATDSN